MANRPSPNLDLPPLDERDIHPQRARFNNAKQKTNSATVPPRDQEQTILFPLHPTAKPDSLPSYPEILVTNMLGNLLRRGPWASANQYGSHAAGSSLPNPDKWIFRPSGTSVYEGSWRRMTDNRVLLLNLESQVVQANTGSRYDNGSLVARMVGIPVHADLSDPLCKPSGTKYMTYLQLDSRLPDKLDRARRMLSSMLGAHEYSVECPYKDKMIGGTTWHFHLETHTGDKTFRMTTTEDPDTGVWFFYLDRLIASRPSGPQGHAFKVRELASGRADAYGIEITLNYSMLDKPRSLLQKDTDIMMLELSLIHYAALCLDHKRFIPVPKASGSRR